MKNRIFNFFFKKIKKDSEEDKKLKNNKINNTPIIINNNESSQDDISSCVVFVNNYLDLEEMSSNEYFRLSIERNMSEIKILIKCPNSQWAYENINLFGLTNSESKKENPIFLNILKLVDNGAIYVLLSGSIGDYIDYLINYMIYHQDDNNFIVSLIISELKNIVINEKLIDPLKKMGIRIEVSSEQIYPSSFKLLHTSIKQEVKDKGYSIPQILSLSERAESNFVPKMYENILRKFAELENKYMNHKKVILYITNPDSVGLEKQNSICGFYKISVSTLLHILKLNNENKNSMKLYDELHELNLNETESLYDFNEINNILDLISRDTLLEDKYSHYFEE